MSEEEFAALESCARTAGLTLSEWVRKVLLSGPETDRLGDEPGGDPGTEVVLAELLALRSLFLNLQFRADKGALTEAELRGLIERADAVKMDRARERLESARAAAVPPAVPEEAG